ncbi:MAG TPA: hypothetical protein VD905_07775, partial [Flavobacteriales bacterium]|nr:hypothetical protein [Flavobacteriales bacterium]
MPYFSGFCQEPDKVNLMNGQTFEGTITDTTDGKITMNFMRKSKTSTRVIEHYRVFSIEKANQPEYIFYKRDTTIGNFLTPQEMRYFFLGEKDARKNYNPINLKIATGLITYGISLMDTYNTDTVTHKFTKGFFKSEPGLISIVAPFAVTVISGLFAVEININKVSNKNYLNEQSYIDGFEKIARSKKVFGALTFSVIGGGLGILSYFIAR